MTTEYIMSHTPCQIAAEHTYMEISHELDSMYNKQSWLVRRAIHAFHPYSWAFTICADMIPVCRECLIHWYDKGYERYANDMAIAITLDSAAYIAQSDTSWPK